MTIYLKTNKLYTTQVISTGVHVQHQTSHLEPIQPNLELFSAISDEVRLKILMILDGTEFTSTSSKKCLIFINPMPVVT